MSDGKIDVSVIVVAWNVEAYIAQAVASCIGQSLKNIEIIVVENGSTDGTRDILEKLAREHSRKPEEAYAWAEAYMPGARRIELFSRTRRPGWDCWGNEAGKFGDAA